MKKITKVTQGKRFFSLILAVVMMATVFNIAFPVLKLDASAQGETIDGVSQTRVVGTDGSYVSTYENYAAQYLNGASSPTNIVIPGLDPAQDYVIQGMTYYPERDWMLVTAYHNYDSENDAEQFSSKVFALDAATGDFVAMFSFINVDGSINTDHGGGIAVSENNIYYACGDKDRKIAYAPLSALADAPLNTHTQIQLVAEKEFVEVGSIESDDKTAYTAYVCYDEGVLWTGNFYDVGASLAGFTIAADEYNVPANSVYNSMVFGYKLSGSSSAEEWANLTGAKGTDCQGNPSYAIGLNNAIKDVQYAVVDNGKLYLSRSFGSGAGNSVDFGFGETSTLTVADIDLSQPGTSDITISTNTDGATKTIKAYDIQNYDNFAMPPMSEGLCFIDDQLFITFEGASNKYLNESGEGKIINGNTDITNCEKPIDVIWQLNPYDLMETIVAEPENSVYYEKIYSLSDIKDGEEYIILHESKTEDPVSQKNYLYALNAEGNFKGMALSKSGNDANNLKGYDGMIGHTISYYSFEKTADGKDILYLSEPEKDDVENIRWTISKIQGDKENRYSIKNSSTYFTSYNNLYFDHSKITMAQNGSGYLDNMVIGQLVTGNGYFYLSNNGAYYLWCNDGFGNYNTKANAYYANNAAAYPILDGVTEVAGTFHCDALNASGANILGGAIDTSDDDPNILYEDGAFQIYRRVIDETSSTYESRVYTNLDSKLEADGTYTVTLDTYAIAPNHYQYVGERPTDYIIVADTSYSMLNEGSTGISSYNGDLSVSTMSLEENTSDDRDDGVIGYGFYNSDEDIYFKHTNGEYYKAYMAIRNTWDESTKQYYYLYYIDDDGIYHCFSNQSSTANKAYTEAEFKAWVAGTNGVLQTASSSKSTNTNRRKEVLIEGEHYRFDNINTSHFSEHNSFDSIKTTAIDLVKKIAEQNPDNRIALVKYGDVASYMNTQSGWKNDTYTNAFFTANSDNVSNLQTQIESISATAQTSSDGIELNVANEIIKKSDVKYDASGNRNVAVILLSDGIPGDENPSTSTDCDGNTTVSGISFDETDSTTAANNIIATAKTIKDSGAFIYTVLFGNNSVGSFSKKTYMDAVSSKYPAATSMTSLGGQSTDGVNYALNIATCSINDFVNFGSRACEEVAVNSAVGLDNLDVNSYLRAVLNDALKFPENGDYSIRTQLVPGEYDEIGRFAFGNAVDTNAVTTKIDTGARTITVTGYDYSAQYISRGNDGNALRITITGLLADEAAELDNAVINNSEKTGIYKTETKMNSDEEFKKLPTSYINIPKYTYVLDYGLQMLDTDVNGTLKSVSADLSAQRDANGNLAYKDISENGLVAIDTESNNQNLLYTTTPTNTTDSGYVLIQRDDGTYDWFEIEVVPASNVYYEENEIVNSGTTGKIEWTQTGTTDGIYRELPGEDDPYGYDEYYDDAGQTFSNNSYLRVDVTSEKGQTTSKKKSFEFTGTGFDLMSACGTNTGVLSVGIKKWDEATQKLKTVKAFMVDTYYDDADVSDMISQVPVVKWEGEYGTYTVDISAIYVANAGGATKSVAKNNLIDTGLVMNSAEPTDTADIAAILEAAGLEDMIADDMELVWFDDNSIFNGGTGVAPAVKKTRAGETSEVVTLENYIDGFRVYNPLGTDADAYKSYEDSEKNVKYVNVLDNLMNSTDKVGAFGYIIGGQNDTLTWADYETVGPQGEVYLNKNQSITFNVTVDQAEKVMLGLRAVNGPTSVTIAANDTYKVENVPINSATEMYYDITPCFGGVTGNDQIIGITITNASGGILAVNHVKHSGGDGSVGSGIQTRTNARSADAATAESVLFAPLTDNDLVAVQNSMNLPGVQGVVKNGVVMPLFDEEEVNPDDTTTPNVPGDDTTGDDTTGDNTTNDDTNTDSGEEEFSIFSLLELLLSIIEKILHNAFGTGSLI